MQPKVARRRVLELKLPECITKGAGHQTFSFHQPDGHVRGVRRRLASVCELSDEQNETGSKLLLHL